ncbi:MAG: T9SS type A sorting domain-containing protein [Ignavibacteria bacterium]|nr:T9SS type A sorting domain-containing protein [Ignavibacteria bacterium]
MRSLYKIIITFIILLVFKTGYSVNDSTTNTINNFVIDGGVKFSFDISTLRNTAPIVRMGSSSYFFNIQPGLTLTNPVLTYVNPKYTAGSPTNSYDSMKARMFGSSQTILGVQIFYNGNGGDIISNDPGFNGLGEKIATVTMDILLPIQITLSFNQVESNIIGTDLTNTLNNNYFGIYTGTLPVELSSFSSVVKRNDVSLNWVTASEVNNSGFEIERKLLSDKTGWSKIGFVGGNGNTEDAVYYDFEDKGLTSGQYSYRLKQIDFNGNYEYFTLENNVVVGIPVKFELSQNYPNPFNPSTKINFSLPNDTRVTLNVYDVSGKLVSAIIRNELKAADYYSVSFNGSNLSSGTYLYTIQTDRFTETKKMVLIK